MRKNKKGRVLLTIGWLLMIAAGSLTAYNLIEEQVAKRSAQLYADRFHFAVAQQLSTPVMPPPTNAEEQTKQVTVQFTGLDTPQSEIQTVYLPEPSAGSMQTFEMEYPDYILNPNMDMPVMTIDDEEYIGLLEIPALNLKLPVMSEWNYARLKKSPCRYNGTAYQNNFVISAHNYDSHFGRLKELPEGSRISFTDADGNRFLYEVILIETLMPTSVDEMTSGEFDLTLFTCTVGGKQRVTVRCDRLDNFAAGMSR